VLEWAEVARPELAAHWRHLYGERSQVPASMRAELSSRITELVAAARKRQGRQVASRAAKEPAAEPSKASAPPVAQQLALPLA
jgi:hypothetical protein